jgi:uncharacterized glyoxalase superfamily protein PhnB
MSEQVVPMIHVPDVRATAAWYESIGFRVLDTYGNEGDGLSFAILAFGDSRVMFNQGGEPSTSRRREVDLYVYTDKIDELYQQLKDRVDVVEGPHDTFYGMREFICRDLNRFWLTFAQPSVFELLMRGTRESNIELVRRALESRIVKPETLTNALAVAAAGNNTAIVEILKQAGAVPPASVDVETLQSYAGKYRHDEGFELNVSCADRKLFAAPGAQEPLSLLAEDQTTFRPVFFDDFGTLTFIVEDGKTTGCTLNHGSSQTHLKRI